MILHFNLQRHCIETAMKRRCNAAISAYFGQAADKDVLESEIAALQKALQDFDFRQLRSRWPVLSGGSRCRAVLKLEPAGSLEIIVDGIRIVPPASQL